ncbi:hypothetical protein KLP28_03165 [Nocardioidaceae bacterium]|nr:hypothetical protein KLP28_03165 [Nocardioidaceae bacterium]
MSSEDASLAEIERVERVLREGEWVRPETGPDTYAAAADVNALDDRRRPARLALAAAAAAVAVVSGGIGLAQIVGPQDSEVAGPPPTSTQRSNEDRADRPMPDAEPGRSGKLLVRNVRDVELGRAMNFSEGTRSISFGATIENRSSEAVQGTSCTTDVTRVVRPSQRGGQESARIESRSDCAEFEPMLAFGASSLSASAKVPSAGRLYGSSIQWSLADHPEATVTFVMSTSTPLRVVGVLTVEAPPTTADDTFVLTYENLDDRTSPGFPCSPAVVQPGGAAGLVVGEAYVDTPPNARCSGSAVRAGGLDVSEFDLDLPDGTDRVRVVGPLGSEITVPVTQPADEQTARAEGMDAGHVVFDDVERISVEPGPATTVGFWASMRNITELPIARSSCADTTTEVVNINGRRVPSQTPPLDFAGRCGLLPIAPGATSVYAFFSADTGLSLPRLLGTSVRVVVDTDPGATATFVMSQEAPVRAIGVLTIEQLPSAGDDSFVLAYENVSDMPTEGFSCRPTVQEPPDGPSSPGEAYVDSSPFVDCVPTTVAPGQRVRTRYDLNLPPGAERVRVVGPRGSEIVVPLA